MKCEVEFHPLTRFDVAGATAWYEKIDPHLADRLHSELDAAIERLRTDALLFRPRFADIRRVNPDVFQYGIYYFVAERTVVILGVLHAARDTESELRNRRESYESDYGWAAP